MQAASGANAVCYARRWDDVTRHFFGETPKNTRETQVLEHAFEPL
jgi:hypothetical protein